MENQQVATDNVRNINAQLGVLRQEKLFLDHLKVNVEQSKASIFSDAGIAPIAELAKELKIFEKLGSCFNDLRDKRYVEHTAEQILAQRILGIAANWEDTNDHNILRKSNGLQLFVKKPNQDLSSQPTICRFENSWDDNSLEKAEELVSIFGVEQLAYFWEGKDLKEIELDIDSTNSQVHGHQQLALFNGYSCQVQYQALAISERHSKALLSIKLLNGTQAPVKSAVEEILKVKKQINKVFPSIKIHLRADSGFSTDELMSQAEEAGIDYTMRIRRNSLLNESIETLFEAYESLHKQRGDNLEDTYGFFKYKAKSWEKERTIIYFIGVKSGEVDSYYIVTTKEISDSTQAREIFEYYRKRGEFEQFFDEIKNELKSDRLSCEKFCANKIRLILSATAYILINYMRIMKGTPQEMRKWRVKSWIVRFVKCGASIKITTRGVRLEFDRQWPLWNCFLQVCQAVKEFIRERNLQPS